MISIPRTRRDWQHFSTPVDGDGLLRSRGYRQGIYESQDRSLVLALPSAQRSALHDTLGIALGLGEPKSRSRLLQVTKLIEDLHQRDASRRGL